jgi:hypothetical protein
MTKHSSRALPYTRQGMMPWTHINLSHITTKIRHAGFSPASTSSLFSCASGAPPTHRPRPVTPAKAGIYDFLFLLKNPTTIQIGARH